MTTIPFVEQLGDAIQAAIADPAVARRRRARRRLVVAVATLLLLGGSLAAAQLLNEPEKLATGSVGCYQDAAMRGSVTIIWPGDRTPVEACAESFREAGLPVPPLVACAYNGAVAVLPGRDQSVCQRHALEPLPPGYAPALGKVAELEKAILAIEREADCLPPAALAGRVQRLLDRSGWTGWTTWLRLDVSPGPCGSVSNVGGGGRRGISGSLDEAGHRVMVFGAPPRSTEDLLLARKACPSPDGRVRPALLQPGRAGRPRAAQGRGRGPGPVGHRRDRHRHAGMELGDARGARLAAGCAVVIGAGPAGNGHDLVVTIIRKG